MDHSPVDTVSPTPLPSEPDVISQISTTCDAYDASRIGHWVLTGSHVIERDAIKRRKHAPGSFSMPSFGAEDYGPDSDAFSSSASSNDKLDGCDDDLLIPTTREIEQTFLSAKYTWQRFVSRAKAIPSSGLPREACDPSIMLQDVPALPEHSPSYSGVSGVPIWQVKTGEEGLWPLEGDGAEGETVVHGLGKGVSVLIMNPLSCRLSVTHKVSRRGALSSDSPRGLGILTLCWSYILSMKVLELQNRKAKYSRTYLQPRLASTYRASPGDCVLDLSAPASYELLRWLCAVLAPGLGWTVRGPLPEWTALGTGGDRLVILTDKPVPYGPNKGPPSSSEAVELLIELCGLFGLGADTLDGDCMQFETLASYTAAFLAALASPTYRFEKWEPQLAIAPLERQSKPADAADSARIRQYAADLGYYMTLSGDAYCMHSVVWSMFWQPDIQCNLVSPWLGGILEALRPLIDAGDVITLGKTFTLRRPRVALWWLGLFFLGSPNLLEEIVRWLETTEGRYGYGLAAWSWPDITLSAWTGSPNSFWDEDVTNSYPNLEDLVPRVDVLRCRFNLLLQNDHWNRSFCWRPSGHIRKTYVELDIWPCLEKGSTRKYLHWIWWDKDGNPDVQLGFRRDTGRFVDIYDDLEVVEPKGYQSHEKGKISVLKGPSVVAVGRMLSFFMMTVSGNMAECNAAMPGFEKHKWQKRWNIRPSRW